MYLWFRLLQLQLVDEDAVIQGSFGGVTFEMTQQTMAFDVMPEALVGASFTQMDGWGLVSVSNGLTAFWPLEDVPKAVQAHFGNVVLPEDERP